MLEDSAGECETSVLIDEMDAGARSCGVTFLLRGDYSRAVDFARLDPESEVGKAAAIDTLLRQGKEKEVLGMMASFVPQWGAYGVLLAHLEHRPAVEVADIARKVQPAMDPEVNCFSAAPGLSGPDRSRSCDADQRCRRRLLLLPGDGFGPGVCSFAIDAEIRRNPSSWRAVSEKLLKG